MLLNAIYWFVYFLTIYFVILLGLIFFVQSKVVHIWKFWEIENAINLWSIFIAASIKIAMININHGVFR